MEAAVQLAPEGVATDAEVAYLDPLDAASDPLALDAVTTDAEADIALTRLQRREASS